MLAIYRVYVRLGEHNLSTDTDCKVTGKRTMCVPPVEDVGVAAVYKHEEYSSAAKHNDIALIKLERQVEFKSEHCQSQVEEAVTVLHFAFRAHQADLLAHRCRGESVLCGHWLGHNGEWHRSRCAARGSH